MTDEIASVAYDAYNLSKQNERDIERHEAICAERYQKLEQGIADLQKTLGNGQKWMIGVLISVIIALAGAYMVEHDQRVIYQSVERSQQTGN